ncbi:MAG: molybdenum cofactor biosynthesis protein MoaE [Thermoplasmataceae archaeon]
MPYVGIMEDSIDEKKLLKLLSGREIGAVVTFSGVVRETEDGRKLKSLYYETQESMATKLLNELVNESISKFDLIDALAVHRKGDVKVGEVSVFVATCSRHRLGAFRGCEFIIDGIKLDAPIWKRDIFIDGERWRSEKLEK